MLHETKKSTIDEVTLAAATAEKSEGGDEPEAATSCDALHQYDGDDACQSHCTLDFPHDGDHLCGNGHAF
jgi:hypothetical protein